LQVGAGQLAFVRQVVEQQALVVGRQFIIELIVLDRLGQQLRDIAAHVGLDLRGTQALLG